MNTTRTLILLAAAVFLISGTAATTTNIVADYHFDRDIGSHLKKAADSPTVGEAANQMDAALSAIEEQDLTGGNSAFIFKTEETSVETWYRQLKQVQTDLHDLPDDASPLERSNVLIKVRETILDSGSDGDYLTLPPYITVYPNHVGMLVWHLGNSLSVIGLVLSAWIRRVL